MKRVLIPLIIVVILAVPLALGMFYVVYEGEQVVITEFGRPIGATHRYCGFESEDPIYSAGASF